MNVKGDNTYVKATHRVIAFISAVADSLKYRCQEESQRSFHSDVIEQPFSEKFFEEPFFHVVKNIFIQITFFFFNL